MKEEDDDEAPRRRTLRGSSLEVADVGFCSARDCSRLWMRGKLVGGTFLELDHVDFF